MLDAFLVDLDALVEGGSSEQVVWAFCTDHFAKNGFDKVIYLRETSGSVHLKASLAPTWCETYLAQDHARIDPFLSFCCATYSPIDTGIDHIHRHELLSPVQRKLISDAADYGIRSGFSAITQIHGRQGASGWNLGSSLDAREVMALRRDREDKLRIAAFLAHVALLRAQKTPPVKRLSRREHDCLSLSAQGYRTKEIARACAISPVTVDLYLRNARVKLGAATREQAVAIALSQGQIHQ